MGVKTYYPVYFFRKQASIYFTTINTHQIINISYHP